MAGAFALTETYGFLGEGPGIALMEGGEPFWATIGQRTDLHRGRLLTGFAQDADWTSWEMHPEGDEIVLVLDGALTMHLEGPAAVTAVELEARQYVLIPAGTWHTADVRRPGHLLAITWGAGTTHRPR